MHISKLGQEEFNDLIEGLARTAHEANRTYCILKGDNSLRQWNDTDMAIQSSARSGVIFFLDRRCTPEEQHAEWSRFKKEQGYVYGEVKDDVAKTHPCLVPYEELPELQRKKDYLFQKSILLMLEAMDVQLS